MEEGAFAKAFRIEMEAAAHDYLVQTHMWANSHMPPYRTTQEARGRAEAWAAAIEAKGPAHVRDVLEALSD